LKDVVNAIVDAESYRDQWPTVDKPRAKLMMLDLMQRLATTICEAHGWSTWPHDLAMQEVLFGETLGAIASNGQRDFLDGAYVFAMEAKASWRAHLAATHPSISRLTRAATVRSQVVVQSLGVHVHLQRAASAPALYSARRWWNLLQLQPHAVTAEPCEAALAAMLLTLDVVAEVEVEMEVEVEVEVEVEPPSPSSVVLQASRAITLVCIP
jgi:hypothetical protein